MPSTSFRSDTLVWEDNQWPSGHYSPAPREQHAPVTGSPSRSELLSTGRPNRESYMPTRPVSSASSWTNTTSFDPPFIVHGGGAWPGDWHPDDARFWLQFSAPDGNTDRPGTSLTRMEVAVPMLEQSFPFQGALPAHQPRAPPPPNWIQAPGPSWQPSAWDHPVSTARQHGGHSSSIGSLDGRPPLSRFQLATFSEITAQPGSSVLPTGQLPSVIPHSTQPSTHSNPVPAAPLTSQPQNERSDLSSDTNTFQCLWMSDVTLCTALITGNRRSITSHLRDEHGFTCDSITIACAWGQCTALPMQRRNIPRHIVACHLEIRVKCSECDMTLSRADAKKKHRLACPRTKMPVVVEAREGDLGRLFL